MPSADGAFVGFVVAGEAAQALSDWADGEGDPVEDLHMTLVFLGTLEAAPDQEAVTEAIARFAESWEGGPITGTYNGSALFAEEEGGLARVATFDSTQVNEFRAELARVLGQIEGHAPEDRHGFIPHTTVAKLPGDVEPESLRPPDIPVEFGALVVAYGENWVEYPFDAESSDELQGASSISRVDRTVSSSLTVGVDRVSLATARYMDLVLARGLSAERVSSWPVNGPPTESYSGAEEFFLSEGSGWEAVLVSDDVVSLVQVADGQCSIHSAGVSGKTARDEMAALGKWLGRSEPPEEGLSVRFWAMGGFGPFSIYRPVDAPTWGEVGGNYPASIRDQIGNLMVGPLDLRGGQMMIWHGPPGTGKTWALRALGREWADWCEFEYVSDPDRFLEEGAAYLLQVLLEGAHEAEDEKWRLLVLEDAGELLAADARDRVGQGLSRFLNAADGFIGQGLRTIMLVTTNEPMESMHPAVARPGRCFAQVEFGPFPASEAAGWLNREVKEDMTLAEMYAERRGAE